MEGDGQLYLFENYFCEEQVFEGGLYKGYVVFIVVVWVYCDVCVVF